MGSGPLAEFPLPAALHALNIAPARLLFDLFDQLQLQPNCRPSSLASAVPATACLLRHAGVPETARKDSLEVRGTAGWSRRVIGMTQAQSLYNTIANVAHAHTTPQQPKRSTEF